MCICPASNLCCPVLAFIEFANRWQKQRWKSESPYYLGISRHLVKAWFKNQHIGERKPFAISVNFIYQLSGHKNYNYVNCNSTASKEQQILIISLSFLTKIDTWVFKPTENSFIYLSTVWYRFFANLGSTKKSRIMVSA